MVLIIEHNENLIQNAAMSRVFNKLFNEQIDAEKDFASNSYRSSKSDPIHILNEILESARRKNSNLTLYA